MKQACKKYKNVYFIPTNAADELEDTSVDGTHPGDYGYTLWARSIQKPLLKILKKYGRETLISFPSLYVNENDTSIKC